MDFWNLTEFIFILRTEYKTLLFSALNKHCIPYSSAIHYSLL